MNRLGRIGIALALVLAALIGGIGAASAADFTLNAVVLDTDARPQVGIKVVMGSINVSDTATKVQAAQSGTTDANGKVTLKVSSSQSTLGATVVDQPPGRLLVPADGILRLSSGVTTSVFKLISAPDATETAPGGLVTTRGYFGETGTDKYPSLTSLPVTVDDGTLEVWRGYGTRQGSPLLLIQGFSLQDDHVDPYEVYNAWFDLAQAIRQRGRDVWVLTFPDVRGPVAGDALLTQSALAKLLDPARGYAKVDILGHSLGGLAARYALARDEASNPRGASAGRVAIFASVDAPQQGMNVHPAMEAALWSLDATAMVAPALQNMLYTWMGVTNFTVDQCHFPEQGTFHATTAAHDAFYGELNALNGDGYPHLSRNIAVAGGGMVPRAQKAGDGVYRLKASVSALIGRIGLCEENYNASALDVMPGSLFPGQILPQSFDSGPLHVDLTTYMDPTMIPTVSAIDLRSGVSKFERTFLPALAVGKLLPHGSPIPGASDWLLQQFTELP